MRLFTLLLILPCVLSAREPDPVLGEARRYARGWLDGLDDIVCRQEVEHFSAGGSHAWRPDGQTLSELTFHRGVEHYALLGTDGQPKPAARPIDKDTLDSRGEFGTAIWILFDPASNATFQRGGTKLRDGRHLRRYDFKVPRKSSQWEIGADRYTPAYFGNILVDEADGSLHWLEMEAMQFPASSLFGAVRLRLSFSTIVIDGLPYVMPETAEVRICTRQCMCQQRKFAFSQYRHFTATSKLISP
jgi:hypothetical protein